MLADVAVIPRLKPLIDGFASINHNISEVFIQIFAVVAKKALLNFI